MDSYQAMFPKGNGFKKPVTEAEKKLFKNIKEMYEKKVLEIKETMRKNPEMNSNALRLFKKIFKNTFMNYDAIEYITPEVRPLRKLKGF